MRITQRLILVATASSGLVGTPAVADEGMWLLNKPPLAELRERHSFEPSPAWLERQQKAAINFGGGSGSFVSARGLVMTNHHVASDVIAALSTPERDLLATGFTAAGPDQELKCPGMDLRVLVSIEDVTDRVNVNVKPGMEASAADAARRAAIAEIEAQAKTATGLLPRVVTLYSGGRYHLYVSKRFTDVRLVFCPELAIANFGGDTDNFEFPRFSLDCCFFRVYEDGKPYTPPQWLGFAARGAKEGDLALVFGHPGRTQRLLTVEDLKFRRDAELPTRLAVHWRDEVKLQGFCARSDEHRRIGLDTLLGVANGRKARTGMLEGLLDPQTLATKATGEARLRAAVDANPEWKARWSGAWDRIAQVARDRRAWHDRLTLIGTPRLGTLFGHALTLVRLGDELKRPSAERLSEFTDASLPATYENLYSTAPVYDLLETHLLAAGLTQLAERFGVDDELVASLLAGRSPAAAADAAIRGTSLKTAGARRQLAEAGAEEAASSPDPLIQLARLLEPASRALRLRQREEIESIERDAYAAIAQARFALDGEKSYPDATGTLRMSFGPIKGYTEPDGSAVPAFTTFEGLYARFDSRGGVGDYALPQRWINARKSIDLLVPVNFVCTADIIGGNSGSPVVNQGGEVVGLIFDGNIHSLGGAFQYSEERARAVAVDSRGLLEALRKVYNAEALARELEGK